MELKSSHQFLIKPIVLTALAVLLLVSPVLAQYTLGPGDVLQIQVWGHNEVSTVVTVRPDGMISYFFTEDIHVEGMTPSELGRRISRTLTEYYRNPVVTVLVQTVRSTQVQVLGEVRNPGLHKLGHEATLTDALAASGGPLASADLAQATLTLRDGEVIPVNLLALLTGEMQDMPLLPGTTLFVPEAKRVMVLGEVKNPGLYLVPQGRTVLEALAMAGGPSSDGDLSAVVLTRTNERQTLDLAGLRNRNMVASNPTVQTGDLVFVPRVREVTVLGAVRNPGTYRVGPQTQVLELLAMAGGPAEHADLSIARLTHEGPAGRTTDTLNLDSFAQGMGEMTLSGGEVLYLPQAQEVLVLGAVNRPGAYRIRPGQSLLDALALAGGETQLADLGNLLFTPAGQTASEPLDLEALKANPRGSHNRVLTGGEVVYLPEAQRQVLVLGQVKNPGSFRLHNGSKVADALALAGGPLDSADLTGATLSRGGEILPVDLERLLLGRESQVNLVLQPGDLLFIPEADRGVLVLGEVRSPGRYTVQTGMRILDLLAQAGGALDSADLMGATLSRGKDPVTVETVNLADLIRTRDPRQNWVIEAGDLLYIPQARRQVLVLGEVRNPGSFAYKEGMSILDALALAGGATPGSELGAATLNRSDVVERVDITRVLLGKEVAQALQPGDLLYIPQGHRQVLVLGEVRNPGAFTLQPGYRVAEALAQAGGALDSADLSRASLTRSTKDGAEILPLDLAALLDGDMTQNLVIQGGDLIYIPQADRDVLILGEVRNPGRYTIQPGMRLLDLVALAGGPTQNAALNQVTLGRGEGESATTLPIDLKQLLSGEERERNPLLAGGDMVYFPKLRNDVLVLGEVVRPGVYPVEEGDTVLSLVARAGGSLRSADLGNATLTREGEILSVDLRRHESGEAVQVQPGDVLQIPEAKQVLVLGEVRNPGAYHLTRGQTVLDLVAMAGGLTAAAGVENAVLTRTINGERIQMALDLEKTLLTGEAPPMGAGDLLYIPEGRRQVLVLGHVARPGVYTLRKGSRVMEAIAMAGGPTQRGVLSSVGIYREKEILGGVSLDLTQSELVFKGDAQKENPVVLGGDIVYVPETLMPDWNQIITYIGGIRVIKDLVTSW